jgi:hypothetical protein
LASGIMAVIAAFIYNRIYFFATESDFSSIVNTGTIISLNLFACLIFSIAFYFYIRITKGKRIILFNLLISVLSFGAVIFPISVSLPLSVKNPELFPGLAVPMIFFPALAWFTVRPLFIDDK